MIVKTRKYQLESKVYRKLAMKNIIVSWWWVFMIPIALAACTVFVPDTLWFIISALILTVLYLLFWFIMFSGIPQLEQFKILFEKYAYEIDSRQILIKIDARQGMPIAWDKVKKARLNKDGFLFVVSNAQLIYLPFKIFNNQNEIKFIETILKRKGFMKDDTIKQ